MSDDWKQVTDELSGLALKLKMHFQQAESASSEEVKSAVSRLGDSVTEAFAAMRNAVTDPAVQDDVKSAGSALRDALYNTFSHLSAEVRDRLSRSDEETAGSAGSAAEGGSPAADPAAEAGTSSEGGQSAAGGEGGSATSGPGGGSGVTGAGSGGGGYGASDTGGGQATSTDPTSGIRQAAGPGQGTAVGGQDNREQSGNEPAERSDSQARPNADDEDAPSV